MQNLVRSKTIGVTGNGGRGTAGAGPGRDLLYGSRGVKRYPETMAHGPEACEPSHPLWPMARRPVSRHTRAEAVDTGCHRISLFSNPRNLESDF